MYSQVESFESVGSQKRHVLAAASPVTGIQSVGTARNPRQNGEGFATFLQCGEWQKSPHSRPCGISQQRSAFRLQESLVPLITIVYFNYNATAMRDNSEINFRTRVYSFAHNPCVHRRFTGPVGCPPFAPCIQQTAQPSTAGFLHRMLERFDCAVHRGDD